MRCSLATFYVSASHDIKTVLMQDFEATSIETQLRVLQLGDVFFPVRDGYELLRGSCIRAHSKQMLETILKAALESVVELVSVVACVLEVGVVRLDAFGTERASFLARCGEGLGWVFELDHDKSSVVCRHLDCAVKGCGLKAVPRRNVREVR
jgi:hypothetical protein